MTNKEPKKYYLSGLINFSPYGEEDECLMIMDMDKSKNIPFAEFGQIVGYERKQVTVRYFTSEKPCSFQEAEEDFIKTLHGGIEAKFGARYSDITGYLFTDQDFVIGGHDLAEEIESYLGKYLNLEVVVHR